MQRRDVLRGVAGSTLTLAGCASLSGGPGCPRLESTETVVCGDQSDAPATLTVGRDSIASDGTLTATLSAGDAVEIRPSAHAVFTREQSGWTANRHVQAADEQRRQVSESYRFTFEFASQTSRTEPRLEEGHTRIEVVARAADPTAVAVPVWHDDTAMTLATVVSVG